MINIIRNNNNQVSLLTMHNIDRSRRIVLIWNLRIYSLIFIYAQTVQPLSGMNTSTSVLGGQLSCARIRGLRREVDVVYLWLTVVALGFGRDWKCHLGESISKQQLLSCYKALETQASGDIHLALTVCQYVDSFVMPIEQTE